MDVRSSLPSVGGTLDMANLALGCVSVDSPAPFRCTGGFSLSEDGQFVDGTVTMGSVALGIPPSAATSSGLS